MLFHGVTSFIRGLLDDIDAATARNTLVAQKAIPQGRLGTDTYLIPSVVHTGANTHALAANSVRYYPIIVPTQITIDRLDIEVTTAGAASTTARIGIYNADSNWDVGSLVLDAGTVAVDSTGVKSVTVNQTLAPGPYLLALNSDGTPTLRVVRGTLPGWATASSFGASPGITQMNANQTYGAFPDPGTAITNTVGGNQNFNYHIRMRVSTP